MKTPVVFVIFNRPEQTRRVFEAIRAARPNTLLVIADGPRTEHERAACDATRAIVETIDWPCNVQKNYSEKNLGCRVRLSSGFTWAFEQVERAIILEDDCLPDPSFFTFCEEMLEKYANDTRVMHISGNFFQEKNRCFSSTASYYFSSIPHIWGWATWRRAWKLYDVDLAVWPQIQHTRTLEHKLGHAAYEYWSRVWDDYYKGQINSWDGQWFFACLTHNGLCINPNVNLVSNIGFGTNATHTRSAESTFAHIPTQEMTFPLRHPARVGADARADTFTFRYNFGIDRTFRHRLARPLKQYAPDLYRALKKLSGRGRK